MMNKDEMIETLLQTERDTLRINDNLNEEIQALMTESEMKSIENEYLREENGALKEVIESMKVRMN